MCDLSGGVLENNVHELVGACLKSIQECLAMPC